MIVCITDLEGLIFDKEIVENLYQKQRIYCKPVGVSKSSKNNKEFIDGPYLCDKYALAYIKKNGLYPIVNLDSDLYETTMESEEYRVYECLRGSYYLLNGRKFGALFLAYENDPATSHAEALIFTEGSIVFINRMAAIAKKECIYVDPKTL